jgi:hypothetical protein
MFENENMIRASPFSAEASLTSGPVSMIFTKSVQASLNYHRVWYVAHEKVLMQINQLES